MLAPFCTSRRRRRGGGLARLTLLACALGALATASLAAQCSLPIRPSCACHPGSGTSKSCLPACLQETEVDPRVLEALHTALPTGSRPAQPLLEGGCQQMLVLRREASVQVCFAHEHSRLRSEVGYFLWDEKGEILDRGVLFPDLSVEGGPEGGCLRAGDCVTVGPFPEGSRVGFYTALGAYTSASRSNKSSSSSSDAATIYSLDRLNLPVHRRFVMSVDHAVGAVLVGFEDEDATSRGDFSDGLFYARLLAPGAAAAGSVGDMVDTRTMCHTHAGAAARPANAEDTQERPYCPARPAPARPAVTVAGLQYSLLDGTEPESATLGCARERVHLPSGWLLAPVVPETFRALALHAWGTDCVVLADGYGYEPATGARCASTRPLLDVLSGNCLALSRCARVLMVRAGDDAAGAHLSLPHLDAVPRLLDVAAWDAVGAGFTAGDATACAAGKAVVVKGAGAEAAAGAAQALQVQDAGGAGLVVGAWARADGVQGGGEVWLVLDAEYEDGTKEPRAAVAQFDASADGWHYREAALSARPGRVLARATVRLLLQAAGGRASFSCVTARRGNGNLALNSGFGEVAEGGTLLLHWGSLPQRSERTYAVDTARAMRDSTNTRSLSCSGVPHQQRGDACGAAQEVAFSEEAQAAQEWTHVMLVGCVRAVRARPAGVSADVAEEPPRSTWGAPKVDPENFAVYADVHYADGSAQRGRFVAFDAGTYNWTCRAAVLPLREAKVARFVVAAHLREYEAEEVNFDNVQLVPLRLPAARDVAACYGDPHMVSTHGLLFDVQEAGDFELYDDGQLTLHGRFEPAGPTGTTLSGLGARFNGAVLSLSRSVSPNGAPVLRVNGGVIAAAPGAYVPLAGHAAPGGALRVQGGPGSTRHPLAYRVAYASGHGLEITLRNSRNGVQFFDVVVTAPRARAAGASGLLLKPADSPARRRLRSTSGARLGAADSLVFGLGGQGMNTFQAGNTERRFGSAAVRTARLACEARDIYNPTLMDACALDALNMGSVTDVAIFIRYMQSAMALSPRSHLLPRPEPPAEEVDDDDLPGAGDGDDNDDDGRGGATGGTGGSGGRGSGGSGSGGLPGGDDGEADGNVQEGVDRGAALAAAPSLLVALLSLALGAVLLRA